MKKSDFIKLFKETPYGAMKVKVIFKNGDYWDFNCSYNYFRDIRRNIRENIKAEDFKEISSFSFD